MFITVIIYVLMLVHLIQSELRSPRALLERQGPAYPNCFDVAASHGKPMLIALLAPFGSLQVVPSSL